MHELNCRWQCLSFLFDSCTFWVGSVAVSTLDVLLRRWLALRSARSDFLAMRSPPLVVGKKPWCWLKRNSGFFSLSLCTSSSFLVFAKHFLLVKLLHFFSFRVFSQPPLSLSLLSAFPLLLSLAGHGAAVPCVCSVLLGGSAFLPTFCYGVVPMESFLFRKQLHGALFIWASWQPSQTFSLRCLSHSARLL